MLKREIGNVWGADYVGSFVGALIWVRLLKHIPLTLISLLMAFVSLAVATATVAYFARQRLIDRPLRFVVALGAVLASLLAGIAYTQASRGIDTVLEDVSLENAQRGKLYSARLTQTRVDQGRMDPQDQQALLERIRPTAYPSDLQGCDLIIEAVFENRELKATVTHEAEPLLAEGGFFASNTSTLPISGLAQASINPAKFIGIHFFSPVDKMRLVEIIRGKETDDETVARAFDYVQAIGKIPMDVEAMKIE